MGGHLHRSNRTALGAVEFLRIVESVALGHELRCSLSQAGDHSRTVAKQSHRVGMAFMDAPAGVHVMQTLVDDRSIGVQKGVWVSRDSFIGALSMSRKARKGSCSFPGVAFTYAAIDVCPPRPLNIAVPVFRFSDLPRFLALCCCLFAGLPPTFEGLWPQLRGTRYYW